MTREQYDEFSAPLVRTMQDMEDEILRIIAAQLAKDGDISDTSKWRICQLARSGELGKKAAELIASYSGVETGQAMEAIEAAALTEIGYVDGAVADLTKQGLFDGAVVIPAEVSAMNAVRAFKRQAKSDLNLVNTVMAYKAKSSYVNAVNKIYFENEKSRQQVLDTMGKYSAANVMGQMSLQESTRRCIRELAEKGIPAFVDKRGHEWSPESYVMMDMRSTLGNTARAAQDARCDEYGINLVEISSHMGARPLCAPYQGRIFSRDGSSGTTTDGSGRKISYSPLSETSFGEPGGLFGINCGHVQYPFVAGCSFQRYFPYPEEENAERYKQFQKQRYMERRIRATKRECMMFNETGDTEAFKKASVRLKQQRTAYKDYSQSVGLKVHNDRTQVYGFDRSVSSKATWAERKSSGKPLTGSGDGGIMRDSGDIFKPVTPQAYEKISNLGVFGDYRDDKLQKAMRDVLDNIKDKEPGTECLALYSHDKLARIGKPNIGKFGAVEVIETDKDYVSIHNHASGETFSLSDVNKLREYKNCRGIFVIGNNGNMYGMVKTENYNDTSFYEYCMRRKLGFLAVTDEEFMKGCEQYGVKYYRRAD